MNRYSVSEGKFGEHLTVILEDSLSGSRAEIALRGATLLSYLIQLPKAAVNIIDGYLTPRELTEQSGARCCIMTPFSNRIEDGFYIFNDEQHQMVNPIDAKREPIHGYTRIVDFVVKEFSADNDKAEVVLYTDFVRPGIFSGYPYAVDVSVKFTLTDKKLEVSISGKNLGPDDAPFCSGWHPYLKTSETGVDHLILEVPASSFIQVDEKYLPLKGDDAYVSLANFPDIDFSERQDKSKNIISDREVNYCYTNLKPDNDGFIRTSITDEQQRLKISVYQTDGVVYVFTGDGCKYRPRKSVAIEPVECITNAYNRPELREKITLKSGATKTFVFGIEHKLL